jgi:hypothetical protein
VTVYFIRAGDTDWVKIGWAIDAELRRRDLQCAHFLPLKIIRTIDGTAAEEGWLHRHYDSRRGLGEWFEYCPTMMTIEPPTALDTPLDRAARSAGGFPKLAKKLGCSAAAIYQWDKVPVERAIQIERLTGISRQELRPDIFGEAA